MKSAKLMVLIVLILVGSGVLGQSISDFGLTALPCDSVPLTINKMTSLVFPVAVRAGIRVSRDVAIQKVAGVDNVLELKAMRRDFAPTNLAVFGADGKLYSFELYYIEKPRVLSFAVVDRGRGASAVPAKEAWDAGRVRRTGEVMLSGLPADEVRLQRDADSLASLKGYLRKSVRNGGVTMRLKGIYYVDGLVWLALSFQNHSPIPYRPGYLRVFIADRKRGKRAAVQEVTLEPVYGRLPEIIMREAKVVIGFRPFTIGKTERLAVEAGEKNGGRGMMIKVGQISFNEKALTP